MFYTILYSPILEKYYIGFTGTELNLRLAKHLANHKGFTAKVKDWQVVYTEIFDTKQEAIQMEKQLRPGKIKKE
jgi:putative endonuclease